MRIAVVLTLACLLALPAMAGNPPFYDNGPINGNTDAWPINFGFSVTDTFTVPSGGQQLTGITFGAWLFPGDSTPSLSVQVGTGAFGTNEMSLDGVPTLQIGDCATNNFGFDVCTLTASWPGLSLAGGTYWITLDNASVTSGDPVYWDENSGVGCGGASCSRTNSHSKCLTMGWGAGCHMRCQITADCGDWFRLRGLCRFCKWLSQVALRFGPFHPISVRPKCAQAEGTGRFRTSRNVTP